MQQAAHRDQYKPPLFDLPSTQLRFSLGPNSTLVCAKLEVVMRPGMAGKAVLLQGEHLVLKSLRLNGRVLEPNEYTVDDLGLSIRNFPASGILETECEINPSNNLALTGLYLSNGNLFTQCEAEGFRRITYFADRPDVMSRYQVYLEGPKAHFPVLLSNGNLIAEGAVTDRPGWHWAQWDDPFAKPSYLFALVAGRFVATEKTILRSSGKPALLQVWVEPGNEDKTQFALDSLVNAIRWDEKRFGLELDLDRFMIVASADFNMGAMENKGLNIFNTKYVFANPRIATDIDFEGVEAVVGHEYFHNWTGNRVTCRDWFQLTLKEGLTVFRDQEFTADQLADLADSPALASSARAVKRIDDVKVLRASQFAEDAGPMAHPIRPEAYSEINNFYTVTVYEKGAEVIRMLQTLLGREGFRKGMDLYFERHDGQAVTCDDFVAAMADANKRDLSLFKRWYAQAGTPVLELQWRYLGNPSGASGGTLEINFEQHLPPDKGPSLPLLIPISMGALDEQGRNLLPENFLFEMTEARASLRLEVTAEPKALSVLRNFSAPVIVKQAQSEAALSFLAQHDSDPFNRWDALQQLAMRAILKRYQEPATVRSASALVKAFGLALADTRLDRAYLALLLSLPSESFIAEQIDLLDPAKLRLARNQVLAELAYELAADFFRVYESCSQSRPYQTSPTEVGRRALRAVSLAYLAYVTPATGSSSANVEAQQASAHAQHAHATAEEIVLAQYRSADNMTDRWAALAAVLQTPLRARAELLRAFEEEFRDEPLVMDKWFNAQASSHVAGTGAPTGTGMGATAKVLDTVSALMQRSDFSLTNPNRARAVVHSFCLQNLAQFHHPDGSGYAFWESMVQALDRQNPQLAARLARALDRWTRFAPPLQAMMKQSLQRLLAGDTLSGDVREVLGKALAAKP
jgi:aminopeptidase N